MHVDFTPADTTNYNTASADVTIKVLPFFDFTYSKVNKNQPLNLKFNDQSTGSPTSWLWNFGDGKTSTGENPTHPYKKAGTYTVTLTATNAAGSNSITKSITLH